MLLCDAQQTGLKHLYVYVYQPFFVKKHRLQWPLWIEEIPLSPGAVARFVDGKYSRDHLFVALDQTGNPHAHDAMEAVIKECQAPCSKNFKLIDLDLHCNSIARKGKGGFRLTKTEMISKPECKAKILCIWENPIDEDRRRGRVRIEEIALALMAN